MFESNNTRSAWKGLKTLSGFNKKSSLPEVEDNLAFANELNEYYARFDVHDFSSECSVIVNSLQENNDERIVITEIEVNNELAKINTRKAAGPDLLCGKVLKECRLQLSPIVHKMFQSSLDNHYIPLSWLTAELVPVPKMTIPLVKNDLRPVALTAIVMKCFERLKKLETLLKFLNPEKLIDLYQFAYRPARSVEDASLTLLQYLQCHLDKGRTYARVLFVDFSSAFNTIQPHLMLQKLQNKGVNSNLILWIHKFLTGRQQYVRFKDARSNVSTTNTGAPQGCVLSASLFTIYESDNGSLDERCVILKYADDTVIIGLLNENDDPCDNFYVNEINVFFQMV